MGATCSAYRLQKTEQTEAHILVCFLSLGMWMKGKGLGTCARRLVGEMGRINSMDVILPVRVGEKRVEMSLRTVSKPDRMAAELLAHLGLQLPDRRKIIENVVQKNGCKCA